MRTPAKAPSFTNEKQSIAMGKLPFQLNIFTGLALLLVAIGIYQAYAPLLRDKDGVIALTKSTELLTAVQLSDKVKANKGKPTLVYFYASWCDTCKVVTPLVAGFARNRRLEDFNILAVAMESNGYTLASYLNEKGYEGLWTPYYLTDLDAALKAISPKTKRGIPILLAFDKRGKLHTILQGALRANQIETIITELK
jgi:thiol:disulfide interchange protein